ncbi:Protein YTP1 [Psilocybe cubensis]|uniref:Protein YTP1 n=1 Tax=Psilocybe cubensis TaxID=181762 RepID=A0ACB8GUX7_PSICU|nr:Protein YTP1 [Psilocybe cubensis]KAH9479323.1 Protein YTP1 [Psilocybe cubensis]
MSYILRIAFTSCLLAYVVAHEHHDELSEEEANAPVDNILWIHMFLQAFVWGIMFPIGMVLGITRSRWHVPLQSAGYVLTAGGYLLGHSHKGQCLAHYIMGSGFIAYAVIMTIIMLVGEQWVRRSGRSPEFFDSSVITLWGIGEDPYKQTSLHAHVSRQSTHSLNIMGEPGQSKTCSTRWTGGILGIYLSRNNRRNVVPAVIIFLTGWAMSEHAQALMLSTKVHAMFGSALMLAGVTRIVEVCYFVPTYAGEGAEDDAHSEHTLADGVNTRTSSTSRTVAARSFQYLTPFLLTTAGLLFMSATDEELDYVHDNQMDHVTYILIVISFAFLLYTFIVFLVNMYSTTGRNVSNVSLNTVDESSIEMVTPGGRSKWYSRVPVRGNGAQTHVLGDDDEDEDFMAPQMARR